MRQLGGHRSDQRVLAVIACDTLRRPGTAIGDNRQTRGQRVPGTVTLHLKQGVTTRRTYRRDARAAHHIHRCCAQARM